MKQWIQNYEEIATTDLRKDALKILSAGLDALDTRSAVRSEITYEKDTKTVCFKDSNVCLSDYERILYVAIGKCAVSASEEIEDIFGDSITGGYVLDIQTGIFKKLVSKVGSHPFPSDTNQEATNDIIDLLQSATEKDLVIMVISGGGSSLLCSPFNMSCNTLSRITKELMQKGATIEELNTVRKHLSNVQGGQLAKIAYPATVYALIFSDVPGDDFSFIASGPVTMDMTTKEDATRILTQYEISEHDGEKIEVIETPKEIKYFEKVKTILLVNNTRALNAMSSCAEGLGYPSFVKSSVIQGEASLVGKNIVEENRGKKGAFFYGGETTVTVKKKEGKGGRNQEAALGALSAIKDDSIFVAAASDGHDNSDVMGALVDSPIKEEVTHLGIRPEEFLLNNDSYAFFELVRGHVRSGLTGINVSDLYFFLQK